MAEWVHKATRARVSHTLARDLAVADHFLCRSGGLRPFSTAAARPVEVEDQISIGDVIHYYCRTESGLVRCFGSFRVMAPSSYSHAFESCGEGGALARVLRNDGTRRLIQSLQRGYHQDRARGAYTGWVIEQLSVQASTPGFDQAGMFPSLTTNLWKYPDESLPRRRSAPPAAHA